MVILQRIHQLLTLIAQSSTMGPGNLYSYKILLNKFMDNLTEKEACRPLYVHSNEGGGENMNPILARSPPNRKIAAR